MKIRIGRVRTVRYLTGYIMQSVAGGKVAICLFKLTLRFASLYILICGAVCFRSSSSSLRVDYILLTVSSISIYSSLFSNPCLSLEFRSSSLAEFYLMSKFYLSLYDKILWRTQETLLLGETKITVPTKPMPI